MNILPWIAALAPFITALVMIAAFFRLIKNIDRKKEFTEQKEEPTEPDQADTVENIREETIQEQENKESMSFVPEIDYEHFGEIRPLKLPEQDVEDIGEDCIEILDEMRERGVKLEIDRDLLDAIIKSSSESDRKKVVLHYLEQEKKLLRIGNFGVREPAQAYLNLFTRLVEYSREDVKSTEFYRETGLEIEGETEIDFRDFMASPRYEYSQPYYFHPDSMTRRPRGNSSFEAYRAVDSFNRALRNHGVEKRFYYQPPRSSSYSGSIWYGTPEEIQSILEVLELDIVLAENSPPEDSEKLQRNDD